MYKIILFSAFLILGALGCQPNNIAYNVWGCYTVQAGDDISSIAAALGTSPYLICDYNSNFLQANCTQIQVGDQLLIPPTCVASTQWSCETITAAYLEPIAEKYNEAYAWIYNYNTEYLPSPFANFSSIGMNVRVPRSELTRICIPGTSQYCYTAQVNDSIYTIGPVIGENPAVVLNWNAPWLEGAGYKANAGWQIQIKRSCAPQQGVYFCYKIIFNDTFYNLGLTFGVSSDLLCQFNLGQFGIWNCTFIQTEGVEIMIPILDANGNLPTITQPTNNNLLRDSYMTNQKIVDYHSKQECQGFKNEIHNLNKRIEQLENQLKAGKSNLRKDI